MKKFDGWTAVADAHGILSASDAAAIGLSARDLAWLVANGYLIRLDRGWYALPLGPSFLETASPWERRRQGLTVHQNVAGSSWADGTIDLATAIVQTGTENGAMAALIAADAALHSGIVSDDEIGNACVRVLGPRSAPVHRILRCADGRAESPGETRLRWSLSATGFVVTPQYRIVDGAFTAVVDFYLEDHDLDIEFDGFVKYGRSNPLMNHPTPADVVVAEKIREDHIRELGHGMVRVIWRELDPVIPLRARIDAAILRMRGLAG